MIFPTKQMMTSLITACLCTVAAVTVSSASWGNTAGIFPPVVNEGHRSMQYRITTDPDSGAWGSRLHYEQSLSGNLMLRGIIHGSENSFGQSRLDYAQAELFWDLGDDSDKLRHGLRFDARMQGRSKPSSFSINYGALYQLSETWQARLAILNTHAFGTGADRDVTVQARVFVGYRATPTVSLNVEYYSQLGELKHFASWSEQRHQFGPSFKWRVDSEWTVYGGTLSSLNNRSPDTVYRLWLTRRL
jgi:hypothetical protein